MNRTCHSILQWQCVTGNRNVATGPRDMDVSRCLFDLYLLTDLYPGVFGVLSVRLHTVVHRGRSEGRGARAQVRAQRRVKTVRGKVQVQVGLRREHERALRLRLTQRAAAQRERGDRVSKSTQPRSKQQQLRRSTDALFPNLYINPCRRKVHWSDETEM